MCRVKNNLYDHAFGGQGAQLNRFFRPVQRVKENN